MTRQRELEIRIREEIAKAWPECPHRWQAIECGHEGWRCLNCKELRGADGGPAWLYSLETGVTQEVAIAVLEERARCAAPELLKACKLLMEKYKNYADVSFPANEKHPIEVAREAIAKAEGKR